MYHEELGAIDAEYTLIDRGHHGLDVWQEQGLINAEKVIKYDVYKALPEELMAMFDIVIMDAPWYEEHYEVFWYRALELVKRGGIVGVVEYPGYKEDKLKRMQDMRELIVQQLGGKAYFASIEVSYAPPDFEKSWNAEQEFTHTAIEAYRPAYMDFYEIEKPHVTIGDIEATDEDRLSEALSKVWPIENGHYIRCREELGRVFGEKSFCIKTWTDLKPGIPKPELFLGWTTRNTVIVLDEDGEYRVKSEEEFVEAVRKWEEQHL